LALAGLGQTFLLAVVVQRRMPAATRLRFLLRLSEAAVVATTTSLEVLAALAVAVVRPVPLSDLVGLQRQGKAMRAVATATQAPRTLLVAAAALAQPVLPER
jgi:hypothetical protein